MCKLCDLNVEPINKLNADGFINPSVELFKRPKTQKELGIKILSALLLKEELKYGLGLTDVYHSSNPTKYPCFARPCPVTPRHGFVDSRIILNHKEYLELKDEVEKVDKEATILFCKFIPSKYSAVLNSSTLAIGRGNDGATNGRSISIPIGGKNYCKEQYKKNIQDYGLLEPLDKDTDIYVEAVWGNSITYLTQLREGPKIAATPNYIPEKTTIKAIVQCPTDDNLLKWEYDVEHFEPGTVVYAPYRSLTSHWGVHCVLSKVPFITTIQDLQIGQVLIPEGLKDRGIFEWEGFDRGFHYGWNNRDIRHDKSMHFVLGVLHNISAMGPSESAMVGAAVALALRLSAAVVMGELRHGLKRRNSRDKVYRSSWNKFPYKKLAKGPQIFEEAPLSLSASGYGGTKWIDAAEQSISLLGITEKRGSIADILMQLNTLINCAHNNGWLFDKICGRSVFDLATAYPGMLLTSVMNIVHETLCAPKPKRRVVLRKPALILTHHVDKLVAAQVTIRPLALHIQYKIKGCKQYKVVNYTGVEERSKYQEFLASHKSFAGTRTLYVGLKVNGRQIFWPDGTFFTEI